MMDNGNKNQWQYQGAPMNGMNRQPVTTAPAMQQAAPSMDTKIDALYSWLSYDLQRIKREIVNEMKYATMQTSSLYQNMQKESADAVNASEKSAKTIAQEVKYSYLQNQSIYGKLSALLSDEVISKLDTIDGKLALLEAIEKAIEELNEKITPVDTDALAEAVKDKVIAALPQEEVDYDKITESAVEKTQASVAAHSQEVLDAIAALPQEGVDYDVLVDAVAEKTEASVSTHTQQVLDAIAVLPEQEAYDKLADTISEKTEASVAAHSQQVLEAIAAIPAAENIDYARIVDEVVEKVAEVMPKAEIVAAPTVVEIDYDKIVYGAAEKVVESLPYAEKFDYRRIEQSFAQAASTVKSESVIKEETLSVVVEAAVAKVLSALDMDALANAVAEKIVLPKPETIDYETLASLSVAKMPVPEAIDYERLSDMIIAKMPAPAEPEAIDYDRLSDFIVSKMPAPVEPEPVDYETLAEMVTAKLLAVEDESTYDVVIDQDGVKEIADGVSQALGLEDLADRVAEKVPAPYIPQPEEIDYNRIADTVIEKMPPVELPESIDYDKIVAMVSEKMAAQTETIDYDKVCQAAAAAQIIPDPINYDRIAEIVEDKLGKDDVPVSYTVEIDEEGYQAIAEGVSEALNLDAIAEKVCELCAHEEAAEAVVEEAATEEIVEEVVEEAAAEIAEEPATEEVVEEATTEEIVEEVAEEPATEIAEEPVEEELAVAQAHTPVYKEIDGQLVDAETGLVIRLKRSFEAKMAQSAEDVKTYYSKVKNELTSYKRINSNVSWHGDRFNFGRETIAKANICGKTLFFYLALDPNDPEFKTTVYHQKDVGDQKAYESTPFKIKVMSETAAKKALRLIAALAEKLGTEKEGNYVEVDYAAAFAYKSTQELLNDGLIKETKEKKVELDFKKDAE